MNKEEFDAFMNELKLKGRFVKDESFEDLHCFYGLSKSTEYFSFKDGIIVVNECINCNNLKIEDDPLRDYLEIVLLVNDFEIGQVLLQRKLNDQNWYLEHLDVKSIISELSERCISFPTEFGNHYAFPYHKWETVMFVPNGNGVVAEINAVDRSGKCTYAKSYNPSTNIFAGTLVVKPSILGVNYVTVCLMTLGNVVVQFTLEYKNKKV